MSESTFENGPDPVDPEHWFDDGNYRYRFFVEPARFEISRALGAESKTNSLAAREHIEKGNERARKRAIARDPRWKVVLLRKPRDSMIQRSVIVLAELVDSPESGRMRCTDVLRSWRPRVSFLDVEPVGFFSLRRWIAVTQGTGPLVLRRMPNAPTAPETERPVPWWARADGNVQRIVMTAFVGPAVAILTWNRGIPVALVLAAIVSTVMYVGYGWALGINRRND